MTTYVLGAGASVHAGYPLARRLGTALAEWVATEPPEHPYKDQVVRLIDMYGRSLDEFEQIVTDLTDRIEHPADLISRVLDAHLLADIREATRDLFDSIRGRPADLYDAIARIDRPTVQARSPRLTS